tara:strand:- start:39369 stop:39764 length:396 start_codon:yes stop_codon:yes gene_type:complete
VRIALALSPFPILEPAGANVFLSAVRWIQTLLLGSLATSLAVIAIASVGLLMLSGRVNLRRGATVILGCFIVFGAASIAQGLRGVTASFTGPPARPQSVPAPPAALIDLSPPPADPANGPVDPYAGASIRR